MGRQIDIESVVAKLESEKRELLQRIRELDVKIAFARELAMGNGGVTPKIEDSELSLPSLMIRILEEKQGWMSAAEIHGEVLGRGRESESGNFKLLIANTLTKMSKRNRIDVKKIGSRVKYGAPGLTQKEVATTERSIFSGQN